MRLEEEGRSFKTEDRAFFLWVFLLEYLYICVRWLVRTRELSHYTIVAVGVASTVTTIWRPLYDYRYDCGAHGRIEWYYHCIRRILLLILAPQTGGYYCCFKKFSAAIKESTCAPCALFTSGVSTGTKNTLSCASCGLTRCSKPRHIW